MPCPDPAPPAGAGPGNTPPPRHSTAPGFGQSDLPGPAIGTRGRAVARHLGIAAAIASQDTSSCPGFAPALGLQQSAPPHSHRRARPRAPALLGIRRGNRKPEHIILPRLPPGTRVDTIRPAQHAARRTGHTNPSPVSPRKTGFGRTGPPRVSPAASTGSGTTPCTNDARKLRPGAAPCPANYRRNIRQSSAGRASQGRIGDETPRARVPARMAGGSIPPAGRSHRDRSSAVLSPRNPPRQAPPREDGGSVDIADLVHPETLQPAQGAVGLAQPVGPEQIARLQQPRMPCHQP